MRCNYGADMTVLNVGHLAGAMFRNSTQVVPKYRESRATNPAFLFSLCNGLLSHRLREKKKSKPSGRLREVRHLPLGLLFPIYCGVQGQLPGRTDGVEYRVVRGGNVPKRPTGFCAGQARNAPRKYLTDRAGRLVSAVRVPLELSRLLKCLEKFVVGSKFDKRAVGHVNLPLPALFVMSLAT
jgi:hypothetical protein